MASVHRTVESEVDRDIAMRLIKARPAPFTLSLMDGKKRSTLQNNLQRLWVTEISEQLGDRTPEEARGECKLTLGVPILRAEDEPFRIAYDAAVKHLSYEQKMALMMVPLDMPVTRRMTVKQKTAYLDAIVRQYGAQGVILTMPDGGY